MLKLYQREDCPFSQKVRQKLTELGASYVNVNVPKRAEERDQLEAVTGQRSIPVLVEGTEMLCESDEILAYLEKSVRRRPPFNHVEVRPN